MGKPRPYLGKVELGRHDGKHHQTEDKERVLVFLLHLLFCCGLL